MFSLVVISGLLVGTLAKIEIGTAEFPEGIGITINSAFYESEAHPVSVETTPGKCLTG
jgi:hypothetical protein